MRFTNESIRDSRYKGDGKSRHIEWDKNSSASVTGLGVRIYPPTGKTSRKAFVLSYRCFDANKLDQKSGRLGQTVKRLDVLGPFGEMTVTEAREVARDWKRDIRDGLDPRKVRKGQEGETVVTFGHVVDQFIEKYAKPRQKTWEETQRALRKNCGGWLDRPITSISKSDAYSLIEGYQAKGQQSKARKTLTWARTCFQWAVKRDYLENNVLAALDIEFERNVTERHYSNSEVEALWKGADTLPPLESAFAKLCLLLSVRKNELAGMRRSEFDDPESPSIWIIPHERTKSRKTAKPREYIIPLPSLAQRIIKALPKAHDDLIFPGRRLTPPNNNGERKRLPIVPGKNLQKQIQDASGVADFKFHDCRDTVVSWLKDEGHSPYERALVLNHSEGGLAATYAHGYPVELKRSLLEKWAGHVEALVQPEGVSVLR